MDNNGVPNVHHDYSMIIAYSPSFIIKDNPSVSPPQPITAVDVGIIGYKLGANTKNAKVTCNNKNISISDVFFVVLKDSNNDGIPDTFDNAGEFFEVGFQYVAIFTLKTNTAYDLSALGFNSVTCAGGQVTGAYHSDEDKYQGACLLNPFDTCNVAFAAGGGKGTMAGVTVEKGAYTLPQNGFTAPTGKQFKAWNVGGKATAPGSKITVTANITVTALWEDIPAGHICKMKAVAKVAPT
jgi:hypothetical protein